MSGERIFAGAGAGARNLEMKACYVLGSGMAAALLCLVLTDCAGQKAVTPLGAGYEEISHPVHTFLPGENPPRISLAQVDATGRKTTIWPSLYCFNAVVNGDVAIFVADKAFLNAGQGSIHPRLFAVESPGLPVDITEEVLWRWASANGRDLVKTFSRFSLATPAEKAGQLAVHLEFWSGGYMTDADWPETGDLQLNWSEVAKIMHSVEVKGVQEKDLRWHTTYIGEKL
jgi:hypothetical protein